MQQEMLWSLHSKRAVPGVQGSMEVTLQLRPGQVTADKAIFDRAHGLSLLQCSDPGQVRQVSGISSCISGLSARTGSHTFMLKCSAWLRASVSLGACPCLLRAADTRRCLPSLRCPHQRWRASIRAWWMLRQLPSRCVFCALPRHAACAAHRAASGRAAGAVSPASSVSAICVCTVAGGRHQSHAVAVPPRLWDAWSPSELVQAACSACLVPLPLCGTSDTSPV